MAVALITSLTPQHNLDHAPCLECASESELMMILLWLFAYLNGQQGDLPALLETTKCWDCSSLSDKKLLQAVIAGIATSRSLDASTLLDDVKCMPCARPGQIKGALAYSIIKYFNTLL